MCGERRERDESESEMVLVCNHCSHGIRVDSSGVAEMSSNVCRSELYVKIFWGICKLSKQLDHSPFIHSFTYEWGKMTYLKYIKSAFGNL